jgi:hypothetical protein
MKMGNSNRLLLAKKRIQSAKPTYFYRNGKFLEKPGLLKEALKREEEWSKFCTRTRHMG